MVVVEFDEEFKKTFSKIKEQELKNKIIKQLEKLKSNPEIGKPMMYSRKGTRELYIKPYRLSYMFLKESKRIILLALYHKDEQ